MTLSLKREARYPPRKPRTSLRLRASLFLPDGREMPILIRNISDEGLMGEVPEQLEEGTRVGLSILGFGIVSCQVRWSGGNLVGVQMDKIIPMKCLEQLSSRRA